MLLYILLHAGHIMFTLDIVVTTVTVVLRPTQLFTWLASLSFGCRCSSYIDSAKPCDKVWLIMAAKQHSTHGIFNNHTH